MPPYSFWGLSISCLPVSDPSFLYATIGYNSSGSGSHMDIGMSDALFQRQRKKEKEEEKEKERCHDSGARSRAEMKYVAVKKAKES